MMFVDGDQTNGHAKHLISLEGTGIGFSVSSGSVHILSTNQPTNQDKGDYISTDAEYKASLTSFVEKTEQALQAAKDKKANCWPSCYICWKWPCFRRNSAQVDAQTKLNAAQNAIAKVQKLTMTHLLSKNKHQPPAKVAETGESSWNSKSWTRNGSIKSCKLVNKFVHNANLNWKTLKLNWLLKKKLWKQALQAALDAEKWFESKRSCKTGSKSSSWTC